MLSVPGGYVGWQAKIARDRKTLLVRGRQDTTVQILLTVGDNPARYFKLLRVGSHRDIPIMRKWFGDEYVKTLWVAAGTSESELDEIHSLFPESDICTDGMFVIPPSSDG